MNQQAQTPPSGNRANVVMELVRNGRLAWRLFRDPRVNRVFRWGLPVLVGAYILSPLDLMPDFLPVLGQLDDLALVAFATRLFIQMAPASVVAEHQADLAGQPAGGQAANADQDVVDADYRVIR